MGFWDKAAGNPPAKSVAKTVAAPVGAPAPWWAPQPVELQRMDRPVYTPNPEPEETVAPSVSLALQGIGVGLPRKAKSAKLTERCPECDSGNYFNATENSRKRCTDCGFPIVQSASGDTMPSAGRSKGGVAPTKQNDPGGFHGDVIVGRVG